MNTPLPKNMKSSDWIKILKEYFIPDDLNDEACYSLIHYFEDLGLLTKKDKDVLVWSDLSKELSYLFESERTILSPHVAGWTQQSNRKITETLLKKISTLV